jgi:hypothetical protein
MHCQHGSTSKLKLMRSTSKLKLMRSTSRFPFSAVPFSSKELKKRRNPAQLVSKSHFRQHTSDHKTHTDKI